MKVQSILPNYTGAGLKVTTNLDKRCNNEVYENNPQGMHNYNENLYSCLISNINFTAENRSRRRVPSIDYFEYKNLSPHMKQILRKKYENFSKDVNPEELENSKEKYLPLKDDRVMKQFIKVCDLYRGLRNEPILCLGRSPKWFLNTALWMKDGIDDYKCVSFSKYWYRNSPDGLVRMNSCAPTEEEKKAYKRYLKEYRQILNIL